mmetsp:Transcript_19492/g.28798  ORF Transcript_19492/g.28798 Transcript_19492/m.28798 type:complete len:280 (+) Transcript_19492:115-954(+)
MKFVTYYCKISLIAQLAITFAGSPVASATNSPAPSVSIVPSVSNMPSSSPSSPIPVVDLGTASNYVVLAKTGISTIPFSLITGNIAVSPISNAAMTGFSETSVEDGTAATSDQVSGRLYAADYEDPTPGDLTTAVFDMETAYTDAAGRPNTDAAKVNLKNGQLDGDLMTPGVYTFSVSVAMNDDITFCGEPDDVFIIQMSQTFYVASGKKVLLDCETNAANIFWQVADAVTIGTGAHMEGNILGFTSVSFNTGSSLNGSIYAQTAVALQQATITQPDSV